MTDTERERITAICEVAGISEIDDLSDGFHTFRQLYYQRMILFATIVKQNKDKAWKSLRHEDGELCFGGGWFIVGIDTPEGSYTYHYEDNYYSLFDCEELERGKHWDGHTEKDVTRLLSLPKAQLTAKGTTSDLISRQAAIDIVVFECGKWTGLAKEISKQLKQLPSAQPELTDDQAIAHLQSSGWMQRHDKEMYESGLKEQLADDSDSYDSLLPSAQPERQSGEWIYNSPVTMKCDQCGLVIKDWDWHRFKICPNCGADMRGKKDGRFNKPTGGD